MKLSRRSDLTRQWTAFTLSWLLLLPLLKTTMPSANAQFGSSPQTNPPRKGMSTGQKVALVGGAALLYYLYRKNQAKKAEQATLQNRPGTAAPVQARMPQLYRSKNGGVYYRDAQNRPVWLTVPSQPVQVSQQDLQRYAPDYNRYRGPAPATPQGYTAQPFSDFDNAYGGGSMVPPGPRADGNGY